MVLEYYYLTLAWYNLVFCNGGGEINIKQIMLVDIEAPRRLRRFGAVINLVN